MKKTATLILALLALAPMSLTSCGGSDSDSKADSDSMAAKKAPKALAFDSELNIRVYHPDSIALGYTLAKEVTDELNKEAEELQKWAQGQQRSLENRMSSLQQKAQNGQITQAEAETSYQKIMNDSQAYEREGAKRQEALQAKTIQRMKQVKDSINNFLVIYNNINKVDIIMPIDTAGMYPTITNPALDITDEIVEGLNARYKK